MVRSLRSPAFLMTAYLILFLYAGPWFAADTTPHRNAFQIVAAVLLAVFAARGSRAARVLMITYSALGVFVERFGSTHWWSAEQPGRIWYLACYLLQIGLLVSTPMYQRTRPGWSPGRVPPAEFPPAEFPSAQFLPAPRTWAVLIGVGAGLVITILPIRRLRVLACPPGHVAAPSAPCLADGTGYPIAYRLDGGILTRHHNTVQWLNVLAPRGIRVAAFTPDWAMWSLSILLVLYLTWLNSSREHEWPASGMPPGDRHPAGP